MCEVFNNQVSTGFGITPMAGFSRLLDLRAPEATHSTASRANLFAHGLVELDIKFGEILHQAHSPGVRTGEDRPVLAP